MAEPVSFGVNIMYGEDFIQSPIAYDTVDHTVYQRVQLQTMAVRDFNYIEPLGWGKDFVSDVAENIKQRTITNTGVFYVNSSNVIASFFSDEKGKIISVDLSANVLTGTAYRDMLDHVKLMIHENPDFFEEYVVLSLTFAPALEK